MKSKQLTIGILAHVDAGKTTLSESILYETGRISQRGRVDHQDAYLDTYELEKARGITIFSKQALVTLGDYQVTLLDTPGHVDFSAEMERTLQVLDYAILVISASDGVQGHTTTLWKLLKRYHVPTFIFVNKMDMVGVNKGQLLQELKSRVEENCLDFEQKDREQFYDDLALCDEQLMEQFLEQGSLRDSDLQQAITRRHVFPVYYGSALKNKGVGEFLDGLSRYMKAKSYPDIFGARVFKISRDQQDNRLTYVKITGGRLKVKELLTNKYQRNKGLEAEDSHHLWKEKVNEIRIYSGASYEGVKEVAAGTICALTGLSMTTPGDGLGFENQGETPALMPVLSYNVQFPQGTNIFGMLKNLRLLEEEEPNLNVVWHERLAEVHVQVMGEIQIEILKSTIFERFDVAVEFDQGNLVYHESIKAPVVGVGHFEPLKHYAEVHLLMEPLEAGSGMVYASHCSEDIMDRNWQRLVLSHLKERQHPGVLTGSALTDMKVTLVAGRGHNKHTEGGDFRQATFRALRQGLMNAACLLLEPVYAYTLVVPKELLGRGISDVERMQGRYDVPLIEGDMAILKGSAPVANMMHYNTEVIAFTRGQGRLSLRLEGYEPCHNQDEVIKTMGYDPESDVENPAGSVFCSKGTGFGVPWNEAKDHMHVASGLRFKEMSDVDGGLDTNTTRLRTSASYNDQELEAIFIKTYGERKERLPGKNVGLFEHGSQGGIEKSSPNLRKMAKPKEALEKFLLVDGYNIVFAWDELKKLAEDDLDAARGRLIDRLSNYQGQTGETVIVVFDAYRVAGNRGDMSKVHNIYVVYTKEAETADQYIEKMVHAIRPDYEVTVATSDVVEQIIILGQGANRLSAEGLKLEMDTVERDYKEHYLSKSTDKKHRPFQQYLEGVTVDEDQ